MSPTLDRRDFLKAFTAASAMGLLLEGNMPAWAQSALKTGNPEPFSWGKLKDTAKTMAASPYMPPRVPDPQIVEKINYEEWGKITFNTDQAVFADGPGEFPVTFFHIGKFFQKSVEMHLVQNGEARTILYNQDLFNMPADSPAKQLQTGVGFAGFRLQEPRDGKLDWRKNDWVAFLGASYFRAIGELYQYGQSARGIAIDVAVADRNEEFPDFTHFYLETPKDKTDTIVLYALLDGPSVTGAYKFGMTRGKNVLMDIEHTLHLRKDVSRLGIAPCTTMYWFSETAKPTAIDWRPEVHDSDGLALWTGGGERIWRPLNDPGVTIASAFADQSPKGYGKLQRDRDFNDYLDGVYYDRPAQPLGRAHRRLGQGCVQLVEIPTDDEIHDNVVAMWVPAEPRNGRQELRRALQAALGGRGTLSERPCEMRRHAPGTGGPARPAATRRRAQIHGGISRGPLEKLPFGVKPEMELWSSRGHFTDYQYTEAVPDGVSGHWRAQFDLVVDGNDPVEMRCVLKNGDTRLSETWAFQYHPF